MDNFEPNIVSNSKTLNKKPKKECVFKKDNKCCNKTPYFNFPDKNGGLYCKSHIIDGMVDKVRKYCEHINDKGEKCEILANYNFPDQKKRLYCAKHMLNGMVHLSHPKCIHKDDNDKKCNITAYYNYENETKPIYCNTHKLNEMINIIDIKNNKCQEENCKSTSPSFNYENEEKGAYCKKHIKEGMVDVTHAKCINIDINGKKCNKKPSYNYENEIKAMYCAKHAKEEMIDVFHDRCEGSETEKCNRTPSYNFPDQKKRLYCVTHKKEGMIDIVNSRCIFEFCNGEKCNRISSFNYENIKKPLYCSEHKIENMINVTKKYCENPTCLILACFNFVGEKKPRFCSEHLLNGMIDVSHKTCENEDCMIQPAYNFPNEKTPRFCVTHKHIGMIDIKSKKCLTGCGTQVSNPKYKGYCLRCFIHTFPEESVTRNYKTKEKNVVDFIINTFSGFSWIYNRRIYDGCSKKLPDLFLDLGFQVLIVEIDENGHDGYDNMCENRRIMELSKDVGHRPIVFIRFNPDGYTDKNEKKIPSCWCINKLGVCVVRYQNAWEERLKFLQNQIQYWIDNHTEKTIEHVPLYFDGM